MLEINSIRIDRRANQWSDLEMNVCIALALRLHPEDDSAIRKTSARLMCHVRAGLRQPIGALLETEDVQLGALRLLRWVAAGLPSSRKFSPIDWRNSGRELSIKYAAVLAATDR
jgi:hypothetical protein